MSEWSDEAVILRLGQFHEADLWLKILSRKRGLETVFAFGGAKSVRRFCGCLDVFNTVDCRVSGSRNDRYWNLEEAALLAAPRELRKHWRRIGAAVNCLRFMEALEPSPESALESFTLLQEMREFFEDSAEPSALAPFFFRLRAASLNGFSPALSFCGKCGSAKLEEATFVPGDGQLVCAKCLGQLNRASRMGAVALSGTALEVLRRVQTSAPENWETGQLLPEERKSCIRAIDEFTEFHIGLQWSNGGFRRI